MRVLELFIYVIVICAPIMLVALIGAWIIGWFDKLMNGGTSHTGGARTDDDGVYRSYEYDWEAAARRREEAEERRSLTYGSDTLSQPDPMDPNNFA